MNTPTVQSLVEFLYPKPWVKRILAKVASHQIEATKELSVNLVMYLSGVLPKLQPRIQENGYSNSFTSIKNLISEVQRADQQPRGNLKGQVVDDASGKEASEHLQDSQSIQRELNETVERGYTSSELCLGEPTPTRSTKYSSNPCLQLHRQFDENLRRGEEEVQGIVREIIRESERVVEEVIRESASIVQNLETVHRAIAGTKQLIDAEKQQIVDNFSRASGRRRCLDFVGDVHTARGVTTVKTVAVEVS